MIDKIAFTGRETMLVDIAKRAATNTEEYITAATILPKLPDAKQVAKVIYTSPFAPINEQAGKFLNKII